MYQEMTDDFELIGELQPPYACEQFDYRFETIKRRSEVHIKGNSVNVRIKRTFASDVATAVQTTVMNITGILDGQLLMTGQPIQARFEHPALRRGEGEIITTSRQYFPRQVTQDRLGVGITIGQMAELIPPLAHALRDYRLAYILPREDGAPFLWRSLESVLWFLADENISQAESKPNIEAVAAKLGIDSQLFFAVKKRVNHQEKFARHGTKIYRDRLAFLRKVYHRDTPPLFTESIAMGDDGVVDIFPVSFSSADWESMLKATWEVLVKFIPYLNPYVQGSVVGFHYWR